MSSAIVPIFAIELRSEREIVVARQRVRSLAEQLGFEGQDQTRIATSCSEIARNAFRYAKGGKIICSVRDDRESALVISVTDRGPGIVNLDEIMDGRYRSESGMGRGIIGSRRLMDRFDLKTGPEGTQVTMEKVLPPWAQRPRIADLKKKFDAAIRDSLDDDVADELRRQNHELMVAMEQLQIKQVELERLNRELDDTNRGVVALYGELDQRAALLQQTSELKSRFLSNMSHEFRTPLNSVISLSRLLLDRIDGDLSTEQEKQVTFIQRSAESLLDMVNDLLDLAKIEAGKVEVRVAPFRVEELFGALRGMLRPLITNPNVTLTFEQTDDLPELRTDESKVSQILRNFISNALKFTAGGDVCVRAEAGEHDTIVFSVSDTGIGIAEQDLERIFEEFTQVNNDLQQKSKGTGLGLPLTRKLAALLGGQVTVQSTPGHGSTFKAIVPRTYVAGPQAQAELELIVRGDASGLRAMIVDDDEVSRYVLTSLLQGLVAQVAEVPSGMLAVEAAENMQPDIIFLDLSMPGKNGGEVLQDLKSNPATAGIPVAIHTSKALTIEERQELLRRGAMDILSKRSASRQDSQDAIAAIIAKSVSRAAAKES